MEACTPVILCWASWHKALANAVQGFLDALLADWLEHIVQGRSAGHVFGPLADDDGQFAFPIDLVAREMRGDQDGVAGILDRRCSSI